MRSYLLFILVFAFACQRPMVQNKFINPETNLSITWSEEESAKNIAIKTLHRTKDISIHAIRLKNAEKKHIHKEHDLTVFIKKGKSCVHFAEHTVMLQAGDVIFIPRGKIHWAENLGKAPAEVIAVFSPPFDGKDTHPIEE